MSIATAIAAIAFPATIIAGMLINSGNLQNWIDRRAEVRIARENRRAEQAKRDRAEHERIIAQFNNDRIS